MGSKSKSWSYVKGGDPNPTVQRKTIKEKNAADINLGKEQTKKIKQFRDAEYGNKSVSSNLSSRNSLLSGL